MTREPRLPAPARWLLRISAVPPEKRAEVHADLTELFAQRRSHRGAIHAHVRLYRDVASLWRQQHAASHADIRRSARRLARDVGGDVRYAIRLFARQPGILLLTVLGLSVGLGISTAAFSIMNAAVLRGEGVADPDRVPGVLRTTERSTSTTWRYDEFVRLREGATRMQVEGVLSETALVRTAPADADPPSAGVGFVSGGFFSATGGRAAAGRLLEPADERHTGPPPVVLSFVLWTARFDRDPDVVGRRIRIGRTDATVIGVAARGFTAPGNRQLWMPLTAYGAVYSAAPRERTPDAGIQVFGRLSPDATLPEAEAQLSGVAAALSTSGPAQPADQRAHGSAERLRVRLDTKAGLGRASSADSLAIAVLVFAVIGLVLLLACANVATVLVSVAITRDREMGVRAALGASRSRIVRQLVTESLALGILAASIGLLLAYWAIPAIGTMMEAPPGADLTPDFTVYVFLAAVTLVTGVVSGLAPAWHGRGVDLVTPLKGDVTHQNRLAPGRLRSLLVMTQAAASVLLIVMAALFVRATFRAAAIDVGFDSSGVYVVAPALGDPTADDGAAIRNFWARAIPELQSVPGIASVTLAELTPFDGASKTAITRESPPRVVHFNSTRPEYFATIGLPILAGRTFTPDEVAARAPVVVISRSLARAYWPDRSPLGHFLPREIPGPATPPVVIGVVGDAITTRLDDESTLAFYEPLERARETMAQLLMRVAPGGAGAGAVQQASQRLRALDPQADVRIHSVEARLEQEASRPLTLATLSGVVGAIAIVLCVIGLYGLTASVVGQRTREIGVRVALGAAPQDLLRLLMWDSLRPVVLGLALGAGTALLASRLMASAMLFGVSPHDPLAFAGAGAILLAAAGVAVLAPTRRAAALDAASVLRRS